MKWGEAEYSAAAGYELGSEWSGFIFLLLVMTSRVVRRSPHAEHFLYLTFTPGHGRFDETTVSRIPPQPGQNRPMGFLGLLGGCVGTRSLTDERGNLLPHRLVMGAYVLIDSSLLPDDHR